MLGAHRAFILDAVPGPGEVAGISIWSGLKVYMGFLGTLSALQLSIKEAMHRESLSIREHDRGW